MNVKLASLCGALAAAVASAALAETKSFDLGAFDEVAVAAGVRADIAVGSDYAVRVDTSAAGLKEFTIEVEDGVLKLGREHRGRRFGRSPKIAATVSMPALSGLDVSSGAHATAEGVKGGDLRIDGSSGAHAEVAGSCDAVAVSASSGAHVEADLLKCRTAKASASSGAHASVNASERVDADASSGAHIEVYGKPSQIESDASSGGHVSVIKSAS